MLKHCEPLLQVTAPLFQWGSGTVWIINVKVFNLIMIFKTHFKTVLPGYLIIIRQLTRDKYAHEAPFILHIFPVKSYCPAPNNSTPVHPLFQLLPVPELIPCRITPQFRGVFGPLGVDAAMRGPMTRALSSLRDIRAVLFCLMDVFVREPTLDWCKYSKKHSTRKGIAILSFLVQ